jgi:RNA polymerase sigma-70 factor, ECF subfamily
VAAAVPGRASEPAARRGEPALLAAARAGDDEAFVQLTAPHRRALHVHCYRMLGSMHDADDALQETLLRAWRGLPGYEPRAPLQAWLHRIATNVALRLIERRERDRAAQVDAHLEPYADRLLDELRSPEREPAEEAVAREGIGLAFIAAVQLLPARQRAILVLRDVLGWPAREVADLLGESVAAVNSALQRARARLEREREAGTLARVHAPAGGAAEARVMRLFQDAWAAVDLEGIVSLLEDDALLTMPPEGMRFAGAAAIGEFFATVPMAGRLDRIALVATRANGQPALAAYADERGAGVSRAYGVMVFAVRGERIAGITGFPRRESVFTDLGLPLALGEAAG